MSQLLNCQVVNIFPIAHTPIHLRLSIAESLFIPSASLSPVQYVPREGTFVWIQSAPNMNDKILKESRGHRWVALLSAPCVNLVLKSHRARVPGIRPM